MADNNTDDDEVVEIDPDFSLKEKIGKDVSMGEIFTKDVVSDSQGVINKSKKDFLKWAENDLKTLQIAYQEARKGDTKKEGESIDTIKKAAFSLKAQAGTFGFDLGSAIAKSLFDFCENNYKDEPDHLVIIKKHIETLNTIFHMNVGGDGGKVGMSVLKALGMLIKKYE